MPRYEVELLFKINCVTCGWTVEADNEEAARAKFAACIDANGNLDEDKLIELGVSTSTSDTLEGTDHAYEVDHTLELVETQE